MAALARVVSIFPGGVNYRAAANVLVNPWQCSQCGEFLWLGVWLGSWRGEHSLVLVKEHGTILSAADYWTAVEAWGLSRFSPAGVVLFAVHAVLHCSQSV